MEKVKLDWQINQSTRLDWMASPYGNEHYWGNVIYSANGG